MSPESTDRQRLGKRIVGNTEVLRDIKPAELTSIFLDLMSYAAESAKLSDIKKTMDSSYARVAAIDQRSIVEMDAFLYKSLPPVYKSVELSPLTSSALDNFAAGISPKGGFLTVRGMSVTPDATTVLSYLASTDVRRGVWPISYASSHRMIRQGEPVEAGYTQSFRVFSLADTDKDIGGFKFESDVLHRQLSFYIDFLLRLKEMGVDFTDLTVSVDMFGSKSVSFNMEHLQDVLNGIVTNMDDKYDNVSFQLNKDGEYKRDYYQSFSFFIEVTDSEGVRHRLVGGGDTSWVSKFSGNSKIRRIVSGIGTEFILAKFNPKLKFNIE